ncbi:MAG TPA: PAS domain S-box protein [Actinomycetota bacterium]|nr:PAS domain S-box protein [Actinomycetota bacterium]
MRLLPDVPARPPADDTTAERAAARLFAAKLAAAWAGFGAAWIVLSDLVVHAVFDDELAAPAQTVKGIVFMVVSGVALYVLVRTLALHRRRALEAERRAADRDAWLRGLVDESAVGLAVLDRDLRFVRVNEQLAELNGVPREDHVGRTIAEVIPTALGERLFETHRRVLETGIAEHDVEHEGEHPARPGGRGYWRSSFFPIRDGRGRVVGVGVNVRDITADVEDERVQRERTETLQTVIDNLPVLVSFLDEDNHAVLVNREWERVLGWGADEIDEVDLLSETYPDPVEHARAVAMIEEATGTWRRFDTRTRSGRVIPTEWRTVRLADGRSLGIGLDLSDEARRERALERSEARYRHLVELTPGVVYRNEISATDPTHTRCVYMSPTVEEFLGYTPQDFYDDPDLWIDIVHPADRASVLEINEAADLTGSATFEYRAHHKDGSLVWVHDEGVLIPGDGDHPGYWQGIMVDITAQRVADAGIHELAESLRSVFAAVPVAIAVLDVDSTVRHWNPAAERIFGWRSDEVLGRPYPAVGDEDWAQHLELRDRVLAGESLSGVPLQRRRKDGTTIDVELSTSALRGPDGSVDGIVSVFDDVTERRRVEAALEAAEVRYRGLVEQGPGVVYLHDTSHAPASFTYVSPQVEEYLGYPAAAWTEDPRFWIHVVHPDDREGLIRADTEAIESGVDLDIEYRMVHADGSTRWVHDHATVIRDHTGTPLFRQGLIVDVTQRHEAEEQRRLAVERQLRLATRLELLHVIDREVRAANTVEQICAATLDRLRALVPADFASVGVFERRAGLLGFPATFDRDGAAIPEPRPSVPDDETLAMLREEILRLDGRSVLDPDSPDVAGVRQRGLRSVRAFAMWAGDRHVGALIIGAREPDAFNEEHDDIGREVATLLGIAINQRQLRDELAERAHESERLADERQQMLRRIVTTQEAERERVALELHDGLGQILTSISLFASDLEDEVPVGAQPRAHRVNELARRAIADSRRLVWSLRPPELERLGLVPALRRLAADTTNGELTVDVHEEIGDLRLGQEKEAVVYRVVQEAVNNALKHAGATAISILLRRRDHVVSTIVEDNGHGFSLEHLPAGTGLGLIGMRERAELVDGELIVESGADAGTRVRLEVPVDADTIGSTEGTPR